MKKTLLAAAALCLATAAQAQMLDFEGMPPYKLGITAGLNLPTFTAVNCGYTVGLQAGLDLMIDGSDILPNTYVRNQVKYSIKGATATLHDDPTMGPEGEIIVHDYNEYYTTHYIDIPVHVGYAWALADDWTVTAETGPYIAYGLGGTIRRSGENLPESHGFFSHKDASRFDYGWGIQGGILFAQMVMLNVSYDWGFKNMNNDLLQNNWFSVGLTYYLDY